MPSRSSKRKIRALKRAFSQNLWKDSSVPPLPVITLPKVRDNFELSDSDDEENYSLEFSPISNLQSKNLPNIPESNYNYIIEVDVENDVNHVDENDEEYVCVEEYERYEEYYESIDKIYNHIYKGHSIRLDKRKKHYKYNRTTQQSPHELKKAEKKTANLDYHNERRKLNVNYIPQKYSMQLLPHSTRQFITAHKLGDSLIRAHQDISKLWSITKVKEVLKLQWEKDFNALATYQMEKFLSFHCTRQKNFESINKHGLIAGGTSNSVPVANGSALGTGVYTTTDIRNAISYAFDNTKTYVCAVAFDKDEDGKNSWCWSIRQNRRIIPLLQINMEKK